MSTTLQADIARGVPTDERGAFKRPASVFRNFVQAGGQFPPEKGTFVVAAGPFRPVLSGRAMG